MDPKLQIVVRKFLMYSLKDISYRYDDLTPTEQGLCSPAEFKRLVAWLWSDISEVPAEFRIPRSMS